MTNILTGVLKSFNPKTALQKCCLVFFVSILFNTEAWSQYSAIPLTSGSFNSDVVAEGTTNVDALATTTDAVDGTAISNFVFVTSSYKPSAAVSACAPTNGFPNAITSSNTTTNTGITYPLQSATGNNALRLSNAASGTMTFSSPTSASNLYLVCLGGNGATNFSVQVNFSDATTETITGLSAPDWCGGAATNKLPNATSPQIFYRIARSAASCTGGNCQYLYELPVAISTSNYGKTINSITITNTSGGVWLNVFAIGKQATCTAPSFQATGLLQGATTSGSIAASFSAASGAPSGYLIVRYPNGSATTAPTSGVVYSAGQTLGFGTVVQYAATTSFTSTGLTGGTTYDYYVYSYNTGGSCGGPVYLTSSPLTASFTSTACSGVAGGTYTVGPTGTYATITAALTAIISGATGSIILELQTTYVSTGETFPITFPASSCFGPGQTLTIRPVSGATARTITSANTTGTINFNGANYVTIDGRAGGLGGAQLSITNTNAGTSYAINFTADASNNTIKYCTVTSRNTSVTSGSIVFGTGTVTGNDNNTIDNCSITDDASGSFPLNAIYSSGTSATVDNSSNTVSNCNISNYYGAATSSAGILLSSTGNSTWTISTNRFFQTATRLYTTALGSLSAITIGTGTGYTISSNVIGFNSAAGTAGTYTSMVGNSLALGGTFPTSYTLTGTANATRYIAINCGFTTGGTASTIQGNTIAGLALYTSSGANTTYGILCGILVTNGNLNIGTSTGNTIGSTASALGSIYAATSTTGGTVVGIYVVSNNTVSIQNNTLGSIDVSGTSATLNGGITGIDIGGTGSFTISGNLIGNTTAGNLRTGYIQNGANFGAGGTTLTSTTGATGALVGIRSAATGLTLAINSNTLRGFITSGTVSAFTGITATGNNTFTVAANNNFLGTATTGLINYTVANSGTFTGISLTVSSAATTHTIQTNDFRGITHTTAGTGAHTYINCTAGSGANDITTISNNTFTNLSVNTTGNVTFIGHSYTVGSGASQTITNNSIVTAFNKGGAGGTVTCMSSGASTVLASATVTHTNNNFSNITVTGATTLNGITNTDGLTTTAINRTITGNTFNNWTGGTGSITVMSYTYWGGTTSAVSSNTITNITGQAAITGLSIGSAGNTANPLTIASNTITGLSSTGAGGTVTGLTCSNTSPAINITSNTIGTLSSTAAVTGLAITAATLTTVSGNTISSLSSSGASSAVLGISVTGGTAINADGNKITALSGSGVTAPVATGIIVSGGTTVNLTRNQICNIAESGAFTATATPVNGISMTGGTTVTAYSNIIGDLRAPSVNYNDAIRGISVTGTTASTSFNLYNNTILLNGATSAGTFGTTGIYHAASGTATTAKLDLRNNIIANLSSNAGGGITAVLRRSVAATLGNYASTSNNNLYYAGTPGATNAILNDNGTVYGTAAASYAFGPVTLTGSFQSTVAPREAASVTEPVSGTAGVFFQSVTCGNTSFLHLVNGLATQAESGGASPNVTTYATDYDGDIRQGSTGYAGTGTAPDIGADEFAGVSPAPSITSGIITPGGNQCTAVAHVVSATITTVSGTINSASIVYTYNGTAQTPVTMTNTSGNTWTGTIPAATSPTNATVAWGIIATNTGGYNTAYTGSSYNDEPLFAATATAVASINPVCSGTSTILTATMTNPTVSVGAGATTSSTYPNPIYSNWANNKMQILYLASELSAAGLSAGNITSAALNLTSTSTTSRTAFTIQMANVSSTVVTTTFLTPTLTQVYTANYVPFVGTNTFAFGTGSGSSSSFSWNGTSNLLIQICWDNTASTNTEASTCTADNTSFNSVVSYNRTSTTGTSVCGITVAGSTVYTVRPRLTFTSTPAISGYLWTDGATTSVNSVSPTTATNYSCTITAGSCTKTTNTVSIAVNPLPPAPTPTNSAQCGIGIPIASVASNSGAANPLFFWYNASSAGSVVQTPPVSNTLATYYSNNFASSTLTNSSIAGAAAISGGIVSLQPTTTSTGGSLTVNASGINSNIFQTDFDLSLIATGTTIADGFSYSIGDDAFALSNSTVPTADHGSGSKIRICFLTYNTASTSDGKGIYLGYGVSAATGYTSGTAGMLGYSTNVSWIPTSATTINSHITISINAAGQLTLMLGATTIFNNVQLPAGFLAADKSTWKHIFSSRSGGIAGGFTMDNLAIQANGYTAGYTSYQQSISSPTSWWISEKDAATGCESSPRTTLFANVSYGDTVVPLTQISGSNITQLCEGATFDLSPSQTGSNGNNYTYTWSANSANSGVAGNVVGGSFTTPLTLNVTPVTSGAYIYTITYSDGICNGVSTKTVTVNPKPVITSAVANPTAICVGQSDSLKALTGTTTPVNATMGTGTTTSAGGAYLPYYRTFEGSHKQYLYTAAELITAGFTSGNFTGLTIPVSVVSGSPFNFDNFGIRMANTSASALTAFQTPTFTNCYNTATTTPIVGNNAFTFTTPFVWDGTSNVLLDVYFDNDPNNTCSAGSPTCWGNSATETYTTTAFTSTVYYYADNAAGARTMSGITTVTGSAATRPNFTLSGTASSIGAGPYNWQWNPGAVNSNIAVVSPASTTIYTVTATNTTTNCTNTAMATVTVNPLPSAPTATNSSQCGFGTPIASVSSTSGAGTPTFKWYDAPTAGNLLQTSTSTTYTTGISTTKTFYVSELSAAGCESSPRTAITVTVTQPDPVNISGPSASCIGSPVAFAAVQTGSTNNYVYTWAATPALGSGVSGSPTGANQTFTATAKGIYAYSVIAYDAGANCTYVDSQTVNVYIGLSGTVSGTQITGCTNPTGLISANVSGAGTVVNNDFTSTSLPSYMTIQGSATITGGQLQITPSSASQSGGVLIQNTTGLSSNDFQIDFDLITTASGGVGPADGISYSYGDDVVIFPSATGDGAATTAAENGSGTKLKLSFDAINNTGGCPSGQSNGNKAGVYLMYNTTNIHQGGETGNICPGVLYYTNDVSWRASSSTGATTHVTIKINASGQVSMLLNNVLVVNNVQLPAAYLTADKTNWKHAFAARTGGGWEGHYIDNLQIQYNNFYEYSINSGTSWTTTNPIIPAAPGTYPVDVRYVSVPACTANLGNVTINTPVYTTTSTATTYCTYSATTPTLGFTPTYSGATYQWQSSPSGANTWSDITGASSATYTPVAATLAANTDFRIKLSCSGTPAISSPSVPLTITSETPMVASTTPASRCGTGTVTLTATASAGAAIKWYDAPSGGTLLATAGSYKPTITATTTYYAAAVASSISSTIGVSPTATTCGTIATSSLTDWPLRFNTTGSVTIVSAYVIPYAAGTFTAALRNSLSSTDLQTATFTFAANQVGVPTQINLNFTISASGSYQLTNSVGGVSRIGTFTCSYPYTAGVFAIVGSATSSTSTTATTTYNSFYNLVVLEGCESNRTAVAASITPAPAIAVGHTLDSLCSGASTNLYASSSNKNYVYTWTPGSGIVGSWVTVRPIATTKYYVTAFQASTGCQNVDSVTIKVQPAATLASTTFSVCGGGATTLNATPATGYAANSLQWQTSPNNSTWTNITGATSVAYTTPALTSKTWYRLQVKNGTGGVCSQPSAAITVNNPLITSTTPASRCGTGTVTLAATGNVGSTLAWYSTSTGGSLLGSGNSFTTPSISATTTYYVAASAGGNLINTGRLTAPNGVGTTLSTYGMDFTITQSIILNSVDVISAGGTAITVSLYNSTGATQLFTTGSVAVIANATKTVSLGWAITPGTYRLAANAMTGNFIRENSGPVYPIALGTAGQINGFVSSLTGTVTTSASYYWFYNWGIITGCQSAFTPVVATVATPAAPSVAVAVTGGVNPTCYGAGVTFTATPTNGGTAPSYQWKKDGVNVGTNSATYRDAGTTGGVITVVMTSSGCVTTPTGTSTPITLVVNPNAWTGAVSNNFSTPGNWCAGVVPVGAANISIPTSATNMPKLYTHVTVNDLTLNTGATLDVNGYIFSINGSLSGAGYIKGSATSTLVLAKSTGSIGTLNMDPSSSSLKVLHMTGAGSVTLGNALDVIDSVDVNAGTLTTGGFLTLKSTQSGTARVGEMLGGSISGTVTVERWLRNVSRRTWRVLSVPTQGSQTIKQAWMENQAPLANGNPGYGTILTSTFGVAQGYDATTVDNSLLVWNPSTAAFDYAGATSTSIATTGGYYVYIRGDRSVTPAGSTTTTTTLRNTGTLYQGNSLATVNAAAGQQTVVGNVYASAIDFTELIKSGSITSFKIWDPVLSTSGTTSGAGAYQTFSSVNSWVASPGGGSYGSVPNTRIESGQAFIVSPTSAGTINFTEPAKTSGSRQLVRENNTIQRFKTSLYGVSGSNLSLLDGNVVVFDNSYANGADDYDVLKMNNFSENIAISHSGQTLVIDARPEVSGGDEIDYMLSHLQAQRYSLELVSENMDASLTAYLEDKYLNTQTPVQLNSTQSVVFTVTSDAGSYASDRFRMVFKGSGALPVTFTTISANERSGQVKVGWSVTNEKNIRSYAVEHSGNGRTFSTAGTTHATTGGSIKADYSYLHENPLQGSNYYRIRSESYDGQQQYSGVARVQIGDSKSSYVVAPNPVSDGNVTVQFRNQPSGVYAVRLINGVGQVMYSKTISHEGGNSTNRIGLSSTLSGGLYKLEILQPDQSRYVQNLVISNGK